MLRQTVFVLFFLMLFPVFSAKRVFFHHETEEKVLSSLTVNAKAPQKQLLQQQQTSSFLKVHTVRKGKNEIITRYQQYWKDVPIDGSELVVIYHKKTGKTVVNGSLIKELTTLEVMPSITPLEVSTKVHDLWIQDHQNQEISDEKVVLSIREITPDVFKLVYQVSFRSVNAKGIPSWPFYVIDAQTGDVLQTWNNIHHYADVGPGGNEKTMAYWYGKASLPALTLKAENNTCVMEDNDIKIIHLNKKMDWFYSYILPYAYPCGQNEGDAVNGGFSPANDALFFGHVVLDFFKNWYETTPIQQYPLIMRVHFGMNYANAFWDGQSLTFGDGDYTNYYPIVSLDIAAHEAGHALTEGYSALEYHDESGALNESFSDMAGLTAEAYLLDNMPLLYHAIYHRDDLSWQIGETIVREGDGIRNMKEPYRDGVSADCYNRKIAEKNGATCHLSYFELKAALARMISNEEDRQSFLVHWGSGVYNRFFYLLSNALGIREAFHVMLTANMHYWTPGENFKSAACGILNAAEDLGKDKNLIQMIFLQVGISLKKCG